MATPDVYPFAAIGDYSGEPYPDWIRGLDGRNGVYVIRLRDSGEIAYVGEFCSDRLYGTLTRHFQKWSLKYNTVGPSTIEATSKSPWCSFSRRTPCIYRTN